MEYIIQSPNRVVSLEREETIQNKFLRFEKMLPGLMRCDIVLKKEKSAKQMPFIVEAKLTVPGNDLFAKEHGSSYETAAESVCVDLENQIRKQKEKQNKRQIKSVDNYVSDEELE